MAKRRKTKRQKVSSDSRRVIEMQKREEIPPQQTSNISFTYSLGEVSKTTQRLENSREILTLSDYQYLLTDIRKITLVTAIIIISELGIFWATKGF